MQLHIFIPCLAGTITVLGLILIAACLSSNEPRPVRIRRR